MNEGNKSEGPKDDKKLKFVFSRREFFKGLAGLSGSIAALSGLYKLAKYRSDRIQAEREVRRKRNLEQEKAQTDIIKEYKEFLQDLQKAVGEFTDDNRAIHDVSKSISSQLEGKLPENYKEIDSFQEKLKVIGMLKKQQAIIFSDYKDRFNILNANIHSAEKLKSEIASLFRQLEEQYGFIDNEYSFLIIELGKFIDKAKENLEINKEPEQLLPHTDKA